MNLGLVVHFTRPPNAMLIYFHLILAISAITIIIIIIIAGDCGGGCAIWNEDDDDGSWVGRMGILLLLFHQGENVQ